MNKHNILFAVAIATIALVGQAAEPATETFGKWRIAIGGAFNGPVRSEVGLRNLPSVPTVSSDGSVSSFADAMARARARSFDGGGYISADSLNNGWNTENWKLPQSAYRGGGQFSVDNAYRDVTTSSRSSGLFDDSADPTQWGISFEVSRELWIYDEAFENRFGVDFVAAFTYFFQRNAYRADGYVSGGSTIREGVVRTDISDADAMYDYDMGYDQPVGGMYGHGTYFNDFVSPALRYDAIGSPYDVSTSSSSVSATRGFSARGDYQELEMLFMLRPWYELADWWRVYAQAGVGVSWGMFSSEYSGGGICCSEDFKQWDCYGAAGIGTMFRVGIIDLSFDVIGRFLRRDFDVDGQYVNGWLNRSDWGMRLMVGIEF